MRALTLKPHWAHAVAHLGKRCENRKTRIPPYLLGHRIAIHAGADLPGTWTHELWKAAPPTGAKGGGKGFTMKSTRGRHARNEIQAHVGDGFIQTGPWVPIATRAIVAVAVLAGSESDAAFESTQVAPQWTLWPRKTWIGWADPASPFRWCLADVVTLSEPVACERGQLGLWNLPDDLAAQVAAATP